MPATLPALLFTVLPCCLPTSALNLIKIPSVNLYISYLKLRRLLGTNRQTKFLKVALLSKLFTFISIKKKAAIFKLQIILFICKDTTE